MKYSLLIFFVVFSVSLFSQSLQGVTGVPDTSFTIASEYNKIVKTTPGIKILMVDSPDSIRVKKDIIYCKQENRKLRLDAFWMKERSGEKKTAVIILHGGGWRTGNKTLHHALAERLAGLGYVCFTPEYRLSTEALYPAAVYDVKAAIRWVRKNARKFNIDASRITIAGHSAGGQLAALMGATNGIETIEGTSCNRKYRSNVNAVVDIDGILAFIHSESGEGNDSKKPSAGTYWFGYTRTENPGPWMQASALTHVGMHAPPILFLNSSVDRMHAGREDYIKILNKYNIYSEVYTFEKAPHSFCFFEPWFAPMVEKIDTFLKKVFNQPK